MRSLRTLAMALCLLFGCNGNGEDVPDTDDTDSEEESPCPWDDDDAQEKAGELALDTVVQGYLCPVGDQDCFAACDNIAATPASRAQMYVLRECAVANCGPACMPVWDCFECVRRQCPAEVQNCGLSLRGDRECLDTFGCTLQQCNIPVHTGTSNTCPSDDGIWCVENCFRDGKPEIDPIVRSLLYCVLEKCYSECYENYDSNACATCSGSECAWEYNRCLADG